MSSRLNEAFNVLKQIEDHLRTSQYSYNAVPMSANDNATWGRALTMWFVVLYDTSLHPMVDMKWLFSVATLDVYSVARYLKQAGALLVRRFERDEWITWDCFIHSLHDPEVTSVLFRPIEGLMKAWDDLTPLDVDELRDIRQFTQFLLHTTLSCVDKNKALNDYIENDAAIVVSPPKLCRSLNDILKTWLSGFIVDRYPRHGSGATSDGNYGVHGNHSVLAKDLVMETDQLLEYVASRYATWSLEEVLPPGTNRMSQKINRETYWVCVPKTLLGPRIISEEPTSLMFFQQAVKESLYDFLGNHPYLRHRIPLTDQTVNQRGARRGSETGSLVTLDLSHASDSVGWDITKACFRYTTLLPWLIATRSRACATPYGPVELKKFANMGSALTFPVECLLFSAVCEEAARYFGVDGRWTVYGDDIICSVQISERVRESLEALGFEVNMEKSFVNPDRLGYCFRESCGKEYLNGNDMTPLQIPRKLDGWGPSPRHPEAVLRYVELANESIRGPHYFLMFKQWVTHTLLSCLPTSLWPAFGPGEAQLNSWTGVYTPYYHRKIRRVEDMPRNEPYYGSAQVLVGVAVERYYDSDLGDLDGIFRLHHWFLQKQDATVARLKRGPQDCTFDENQVVNVPSIGPKAAVELVSQWQDPTLAR